MRITLKYMEMAFYDKDSPDSITAISPIAKCKEGPINFLYDYYEYARMGEPIIANGAIHWTYNSIWYDMVNTVECVQ